MGKPNNFIPKYSQGIPMFNNKTERKTLSLEVMLYLLNPKKIAYLCVHILLYFEPTFNQHIVKQKSGCQASTKQK